MIPLLFDLRGETVLIFGGGPVGARRARRFASEARTIVVSPTFAPERFGGATLVRAAPTGDDVTVWIDRSQPALVVSATDDEAVNDAVMEAAGDAGIPVNRADRPGSAPGTVLVPASVRDGDVTVAIATGGRSPAVSAHLRRQIEPFLEGAGRMVDLTADLKADLRRRDIEPDRVREVVRAVTRSGRVWEAMRTGDDDADMIARRIVERKLEAEE